MLGTILSSSCPVSPPLGHIRGLALLVVIAVPGWGRYVGWLREGWDILRLYLATMHRQCPIWNQKKGISSFPTQLHLNPPCLECKHAWKPSGIKYNATALKVTHGKTPIRLLGIRYNMWLDGAAQRRYVMDGITEMACFLRKNRDLSIENGLRLVECTLGPLLA